MDTQIHKGSNKFLSQVNLRSLLIGKYHLTHLKNIMNINCIEREICSILSIQNIFISMHSSQDMTLVEGCGNMKTWA